MLKCSPSDFSPRVEPLDYQRYYVRAPPQDLTECNYLVMFFVLGVFAMAIFDNLRK